MQPGAEVIAGSGGFCHAWRIAPSHGDARMGDSGKWINAAFTGALFLASYIAIAFRISTKIRESQNNRLAQIGWGAALGFCSCLCVPLVLVFLFAAAKRFVLH